MDTGFARPRAGDSQTFNAPLLIFVITIGINLFLVLKMESEYENNRKVKNQRLSEKRVESHAPG